MVCIVRLKLELCVTSLGSTLQYFMALASTVLHGPHVLKRIKVMFRHAHMDAPWEVSAKPRCPNNKKGAGIHSPQIATNHQPATATAAPSTYRHRAEYPPPRRATPHNAGRAPPATSHPPPP